MKEKIYDAQTGMEYVLVGDYYLPALKLPRTRPIGRWGMLHKAYLKLRKPAYYQSLLLSGKLDTVLANVEEQASTNHQRKCRGRRQYRPEWQRWGVLCLFQFWPEIHDCD